MSIVYSFRLDGRVALVTGAGRGIGEGTAIGLAEAGADLALLSRTRAELDRVAEQIRALGRGALPVVCDVADAAVIPSSIQQVVDAFGRIDILVNCAGIQRRMTVLEATVGGWEQVINPNWAVPTSCVKPSARAWSSSDKGRSSTSPR